MAGKFTEEQRDWMHTLIGSWLELRELIRTHNVPFDEDLPAEYEMITTARNVVDEMSHQIDMESKPLDLPSDAEVADMYATTNGEPIPF